MTFFWPVTMHESPANCLLLLAVSLGTSPGQSDFGKRSMIYVTHVYGPSAGAWLRTFYVTVLLHNSASIRRMIGV